MCRCTPSNPHRTSLHPQENTSKSSKIPTRDPTTDPEHQKPKTNSWRYIGSLASQNTHRSLPGSWNFSVLEFHTVTLRDSDPRHHTGSGLRVPLSRGFCRGGKSHSCFRNLLLTWWKTADRVWLLGGKVRFLSSGFRTCRAWTLSGTCSRHWGAACPRGRRLPWRRSRPWRQMWRWRVPEAILRSRKLCKRRVWLAAAASCSFSDSSSSKHEIAPLPNECHQCTL